MKDRAARGIISAAARAGHKSIVEATAGNTGISLAMLARPLGIAVTCVCPDKTSQAKIDLLRSLGATVIVCPSGAVRDTPDHFQRKAELLAEQTGALYANQFANPANFDAHLSTTGPEIWRQCGGKVDAIAFASGTGGSLAGTSVYLKQRNPAIRCVLVNTSDAGVVAANATPPITLRLRTAEEAKLTQSSSLEGVGSRCANTQNTRIHTYIHSYKHAKHTHIHTTQRDRVSTSTNSHVHPMLAAFCTRISRARRLTMWSASRTRRQWPCVATC